MSYQPKAAGRQKICIGIDNVLADTDTVMRRVIFEYTKKRVDLRYEDIVDFVYHRCADLNGNCITKDEWEIVHTLVSEARYLWLIQPFEGVQAFLERLHQKFDLNFATARRAEPVTGSAISKWATALETSREGCAVVFGYACASISRIGGSPVGIRLTALRCLLRLGDGMPDDRRFRVPGGN